MKPDDQVTGVGPLVKTVPERFVIVIKSVVTELAKVYCLLAKTFTPEYSPGQESRAIASTLPVLAGVKLSVGYFEVPVPHWPSTFGTKNKNARMAKKVIFVFINLIDSYS